jgi:DNA (cytosine-5)-methyltransferase 1
VTYTGITLCSGGGLAALGLQAAGVQLVGAVEYDPAIAAVYSANLGDHITVAPVQEVDYRPWAGVDVLQVSPPCPSFSVAKAGGQETELDTAIAAAIVRAITTIRPRVLWVENVEGYAASASYRAIRAALDNLDYWSHATVVNAADMGVAQTRRRLILRAVSGGWMQPFRPLPAALPWVGWYAAIADLIPTLPESAFADWQEAYRPPAPTRAYIINRNMDKYGDGLRWADQPMFTVSTHSGERWHTWLEEGRIVHHTSQSLARWQSVPDNYRLPADPALAAHIIGNGVACLVAQAVTESLLDGQAVAT